MSYRIQQSNGMAVLDHAACKQTFKQKTDAELHYIIEDATEALEALPDGPNASVYADECIYAAQELSAREERIRQLADSVVAVNDATVRAAPNKAQLVQIIARTIGQIHAFNLHHDCQCIEPELAAALMRIVTGKK